MEFLDSDLGAFSLSFPLTFQFRCFGHALPAPTLMLIAGIRHYDVEQRTWKQDAIQVCVLSLSCLPENLGIQLWKLIFFLPSKSSRNVLIQFRGVCGGGGGWGARASLNTDHSLPLMPLPEGNRYSKVRSLEDSVSGMVGAGPKLKHSICLFLMNII